MYMMSDFDFFKVVSSNGSLSSNSSAMVVAFVVGVTVGYLCITSVIVSTVGSGCTGCAGCTGFFTSSFFGSVTEKFLIGKPLSSVSYKKKCIPFLHNRTVGY